MPSILLVALPLGVYLYISSEIALGIIEPLLKLVGYVNEMQIIKYIVQVTDRQPPVVRIYPTILHDPVASFEHGIIND